MNLNETKDELAEEARGVALSVVVPTFNERVNVLLLIEKLEMALAGIAWEVIFVDDHSPDGTASVLREVAQTNTRVRVMERVGRRGLASACIEGMMASAAPYLAVMDADLQHDESVLPEMLRKIQTEKLDVVIASRRAAGGSMGDFAERRVRLSDIGTKIGRMVAQCEATDAMSGFFVVEAKFFRATVPRLTGTGFKILLDILASSKRRPRVGEVAYHFRTRQAGESKLDANVALEYLFLIVDKLIGRWVPTRFVVFGLVGALGVGVHLGVLAVLYRDHHISFLRAQAIATLVSMTFNFVLNNAITFRDRRLTGVRFGIGLMKFYVACAIGAVMNVGFAGLLMRHGVRWYVVGVAGTAISSVWNYWVNAVVTWRRARR